MGEICFVCADLGMFSFSNSSILAFSKLRLFGPVRYGAECTGRVDGPNNLILCFAVLMRPRWLSYVCWNS